jgi:hypothetical protein
VYGEAKWMGNVVVLWIGISISIGSGWLPIWVLFSKNVYQTPFPPVSCHTGFDVQIEGEGGRWGTVRYLG